MTETEAKVVAAWQEAADELGIQFTSPFALIPAGGPRQEHIGLVHQFGQRVGTLISVLGEPSERVSPSDCASYYWSILGPGYCTFDRKLFIDTLDDWKFFGPEAARPQWYSGKSWS